MLRLKLIVLALLMLLPLGTPAMAQTVRVTADVYIATQHMEVRVDGQLYYNWSVSTARPGKKTPIGTFTPYWLSPNHVSSIYDSPMPWSVFFDGDYAVHGTFAVAELGTPVSMGCVRLLIANAEIFYRLVEQYGMRAVRVRVF